jgi:hypothetical protein
MASLHRGVLTEIVTRIDPADLPDVERALSILSASVTRVIAEYHANV